MGEDTCPCGVVAPVGSFTVDAQEFLGLTATHNPHRWYLPVTNGLSTLGGFLFGGCGLGAAVLALEMATGRPVVWATAQYLSYATPGSVLDLDVTVAVSGRNSTQARVVGHVEDREIFTVNAALGSRSTDSDQVWVEPIDVPRPEDCPARSLRVPGEDSLMSRFETRLALARDWEQLPGNPMERGRSALWVRIPELTEPSAVALAILGDYVPFGIGQSLGAYAGGNSLDNTLRVIRVVPSEWILVEVQVDGIGNGFGHGTVHLWADDGTLMATASQSTIVRYWDPAGTTIGSRPSLPPQDRG